MTGGRLLLGRDGELRGLRDRLDSIDVRGCAIGLVGEAGVGKSALQAAVVDEARARGFTVLAARGSESETHLPFASLHQLLRPILSDSVRLPARQKDALLSGFGMSDVAAPDPFLIALAVLELVVDAARQAPVLLSLDDLQWMDEPSVDAAAFVARRIEGERVMLLASARVGSTLIADDPSMEWVSVAGIDESSASALVDECAPDLAPVLRERVLREAGGNPLALLEFPVAMRSGRFGWTELSEDLPMTVRLERAFMSRTGHLPAVTRVLLMVAALDDGTDLAEMLAAASIVVGAEVGVHLQRPLTVIVVGPRGVRVNTVSPGPVETALWLGHGGVAETVGRAQAIDPAAVKAAAVAGTPTERFTRPDEVAELVMLLASNTVGNITGTDVLIDGGMVTTL